MNNTLVFTFIGADRPGLVERLANIVTHHKGNWLESRMVQLAGQFAGIAKIELPPDEIDALSAALIALAEEGLLVTLQTGSQQAAPTNMATQALHVLGPDRRGIVLEIGRALKQRQINVREMSSNVTSAAMSGDPLFEARLLVEIPPETALDELFDQLDEIAEKLGVDIATDEP